MEPYEQLAEVLKALGHPLRLQILEVLRQEEEACVCHLEARLGQRQAYISQQLARLREAGLVADRREGMNVYYSLSADAPPRILDAITITLQETGARVQTRADSDPCPCPRCQARALAESPHAPEASPL